MITIEDYNLYYNTEHIIATKPKTIAEILNRLQKIDCTLFYNIVSSPTCRYEKKFSDGRIKEHYKYLGAKDRFKNIFEEKTIYANPKSFFVDKINGLPKDCNELKSVSFTLSDFQDIPKHFIARDSEFGICFSHDFLQNNGIRPVEYLNTNDPDRNRKLIFNSPHLIEVFNTAYDMRWENEWRIKSDLKFSQMDVAFVIVPSSEHEHFVEWFMESADFSDTIILSSNTFKSHIDHLIEYPQLKDNNWDQVRIFGDSLSSGLKVNPNDFNNLDYASKQSFALEYKNELNCFAKNTILLSYEFQFLNRYKQFRNKINNINSLGYLFSDYKIINDNINEPQDSQKDLLIHLLGELYLHFFA